MPKPNISLTIKVRGILFFCIWQWDESSITSELFYFAIAFIFIFKKLINNWQFKFLTRTWNWRGVTKKTLVIVDPSFLFECLKSPFL